MESNGSKTYFVVVDVKIPVTVAVNAATPDEAMRAGEARAREVIETYLNPRARKEVFRYVAVKVTEAPSTEDAHA